MSTFGMLGSALLPGHTHLRIHLQRAGVLSPDGRGVTLCGAPPVTLERIEAAREGLRLWGNGRASPLPRGPGDEILPVQLVTCRECIHRVELHVLSPWADRISLDPGVGLTACGFYAIARPTELTRDMSDHKPCPRDRLLDFEAYSHEVESDGPEVWRICPNCRSQIGRHERLVARRQANANGAPALDMGKPEKSLHGARKRLSTSQRRLAKAVESNPRAAIDPAMAELAERDRRELANED